MSATATLPLLGVPARTSCHGCPAERCAVCGLTQIIEGARAKTLIVARSAAMQAVLRRAARFASAEAPVAILGESGTGKEVVARALHANSRRADAPFVAVNVAALPAELLESELFGHARGAFTGAVVAKRGLFEAADRGTLFLDEIAEMPLALQAKLLRVLQDGEVRRVGETRTFGVDVRIVCATHRNLVDQVARGAFREDLMYRLRVLTLHVPPLRERVEDVLPLARLFIEQAADAELRLTSAACKLLERYVWPGNVRELSNAVRYGTALAQRGSIDVGDLPEELRAPAPTLLAATPAKVDVLRTLADVEREHVMRVLEACGGSQTEAARVLGIGRNTLWRKLRRIA